MLFPVGYKHGTPPGVNLATLKELPALEFDGHLVFQTLRTQACEARESIKPPLMFVEPLVLTGAD